MDFPGGLRALLLRFILRVRGWLPICAMFLFLAPAIAQPTTQSFHSRHYLLTTDLPESQAIEVLDRMERFLAMFAERAQLKDADLASTMAMHVFRRAEDYWALGFSRDSAGVFDGQTLSIVAGEGLDDRTWHLLQHEAVHQLLARRRVSLPPWLEEGLAEYFGEALFDGQEFTTAILPAWRVERLQCRLRDANISQARRSLLGQPRTAWNEHVNSDDYDLAWSMVHFLIARGPGTSISALLDRWNESTRQATDDDNRDLSALAQHWSDYWLSMGNDPGADLYARCALCAYARMLRESTAQGLHFGTFDELVQAGNTGKLYYAPGKFVPADLWRDADGWSKNRGAWSIELDFNRGPAVSLRRNGKKWVGRLEQANGRVAVVSGGVENPVETAPREGAKPRATSGRTGDPRDLLQQPNTR